jgi:hypothetical protein
MENKKYCENEKKPEANALPLFLKALDFMKEREGFKTAELQKFLGCSYHNIIKVLDTAEALGVILKNEDEAAEYRYKLNL